MAQKQTTSVDMSGHVHGAHPGVRTRKPLD
jgi:hypothetical protein